MKLKTTLLAAAAALAIAPAANAYEGLYGAVGAGLNYMDPDLDFSNDGPGGAGPYTFDTSADYDKGIGAYVAGGYAWGDGVRTELEVAWRNNDIRHIAPDGGGYSGWPEGTITGDVEVLSFMANALYDFEGLIPGSTATPYVGVGAGAAIVDFSLVGANALGIPAPATLAVGPNKTTFAYQGIAGVAFDVTERIKLDISYRYFRTLKENYTATLNGAPASIAQDYIAHDLFAGLRFALGPSGVQYKDCWDGSSVPVKAECPPQLVEDQDASLEPIGFTVYFDYDKSNLTSEAQALIREAASRALENDIETVVVAGNTDTSGSSAYNQALSERRAVVVRDALVANGVPADRIVVEAYGETNLAKPTPDGVREPLNRRSDVTISFM